MNSQKVSDILEKKPTFWMCVRLLLTQLIITMAFFGCSSDNGTNPGLPEEVGVAGDGQLAAILESVRSANDLPSLGAMLVRGDQVVEMGAVGLRAVGFPEEVTIDDRWHLGSLTKAMTATLAARLVEQGVISWDITVGEVFPDLINSIRSEYVDVRLDELLYHTAGLPVDVNRAPSSVLDPPSLPEQRRRWAAALMALAPDATRGKYLYTNAGYVVAGSMLEEVTGELWEEHMRREVFAPLGMNSTDFGAPGTPGSRDEPWGHERQGSSWRAIEPGPNADNVAAVGPAGTVHTTLTDYAQYMIAHLAGARGFGGLVSAATFRKLHTPAPGVGYSLGWGVGERGWAGGRVLQHAGSNGKWYAVVWIAPERNFAMLAVTNAGGDFAERGTDAAIQALIKRFDAALGK